jgi:hypothetical protein
MSVRATRCIAEMGLRHEPIDTIPGEQTQRAALAVKAPISETVSRETRAARLRIRCIQFSLCVNGNSPSSATAYKGASIAPNSNETGYQKKVACRGSTTRDNDVGSIDDE